MAFARRKTKHKNGFTLPEVLVVVALLAVLLAFAVPAILGYVRRLKLRALDTDAQSIFMAAQNRLTAMADSGELKQLQATDNSFAFELPTAEPEPDVATNHISLSYLSSDAAAKPGTDNEKIARDLAAILPFGSIESRLRAGHFVVEFSRRTGTVYAVWYTDEDGFTYDPDKRWPTDFEERRKADPLVGYYGGSAVDRAAVGQMPDPQVELLNAEVLRLRVCIPKMTGASAEVFAGENITVRVGLSPLGQEGSDATTLWLDGALDQNTLQASEDYDVYGDVLLDAAWPDDAVKTLYDETSRLSRELIDGGRQARLLGCKQFRQWVGYTRLDDDQMVSDNKVTNPDYGRYVYTDPTSTGLIVPGENITVTVRLEYTDDNGTPYRSQDVYANANSLFSAIKGDETKSGAYVAQLTYCRHLQNLCAHVNGVYYDGTVAGKVKNSYQPFISGLYIDLTGAELIRDLDFINAEVAKTPAEAVRSWAGCYGYDDTAYGDGKYSASAYAGRAHRFESIYCTAAKDLLWFDGGGLSIRNLNVYYDKNVQANDKNPAAGGGFWLPHAGLFGFIIGGKDGGLDAKENREVRDLTLVNAWALNSRRAGTLAAVAQRAEFSNCRSWLEGDAVLGDDPVPHVGLLSTTEESAGGLIGQVMNVSLSHCSASTVIAGNPNASQDEGTGGLVGNIGQSTTTSDPSVPQNTFTNCYAASYILDGARVGGLIGGRTGNPPTAVKNCYAAGYIADATTYAAGLLGSSEGSDDLPAVSNSYAAVKYGDGIFDAAGMQAVPVYGAAKYDVQKTKNTDLYYIRQPGVTYSDPDTDLTRPAAKGLDPAALHEMVGDRDGTNIFNKTNGWYVPAGGAADHDNPTYAVFPYHQIDRDPDDPTLDTPYPYPMLRLALNEKGEMQPPSSGSDTMPAVPMLHYGDWLESDEVRAIAAYYEQYPAATAGGPAEYGFYTTNGPDGKLINTLRTGTPGGDIAAADGYALLVPTGEKPPAKVAYALAGTAGANYIPLKEFTNADAPAATDVKFETGGDGYDVYLLPVDPDPAGTAVPGVPAGETYYYALQADGTDIAWFNPHFACEAHAVPTAAAADPYTPLPKPGAAGKGSADVHNGVVIRTARQLGYMVRYTVGDAAFPSSAVGDRPMGWAYEQLLDIDYARYTGARPAGVADAASREPAGSEANPQQAAALVSGSYNGHGHLIKNLYLAEDAFNYAGLFGFVYDSSLTGIRLVNVKVTASASSPAAGGLAASVGAVSTGSLVSDCGIYVEEPDDYDTFTVSSLGGNVGGLIGTISKSSGTTVENSFAAVKVSGTDGVGGLIGSITDNTADVVLTNCYAGGHTVNGLYAPAAPNVSGASSVGGFVGLIDDNTALPQLKGINYSTCSAGVERDANKATLGAFAGQNEGIAAPGTGDMLYATGAAFAAGAAAAPRDESAYLTGLIPEITGRSTNGDWFTTAAYDSALHTDLNANAVYPYPTNLDAHHGDWAMRPVLVYYEKYTAAVANNDNNKDCGILTIDSDRYGFYAQWLDADGVTRQDVNTLARDGWAVDSGYAVLSARDLGDSITAATTTYGQLDKNDPNAYGIKPTGSFASVKKLQPKDGPLKGYTLYLLSPELLTAAAPTDTYYRPLTVNGAAAGLFNPHFACEALNRANGKAQTVAITAGPAADHSYTLVPYSDTTPQAKPGAGGKGSTDPSAPAGTSGPYAGEVVIRTPAHLAAAARYTRTGNTAGKGSGREQALGWQYHQLLDLDYAQYTGYTYDGNEILRNSYSGNKNGGNFAGKSVKEDDKTYVYPQLPVTLGLQKKEDKDSLHGGYDGHDHAIIGLYAGVDREYKDPPADVTPYYAAGVFGWVYKSTLKNIRLQDVTVTTAAQNGKTYNTDMADSVGGLVGRFTGDGDHPMQNIRLTDVTVTVDDKATEATYVGGAAGRVHSASLVSNVTGVNVSVRVDAGKVPSVGGLFGSIEGSGTKVTGCGIRADSAADYDTAAVVYNGKDAGAYAGGFAGSVSAARVSDCYAAVKVRGWHYAGGFAGQLRCYTTNGGTVQPPVVTNCYAGGHTENGVYASADESVNVTVQDTGAAVGGFAGILEGNNEVTNSVIFRGVNYSTCSVGVKENGSTRGLFIGQTKNVQRKQAAGAKLYAAGQAFLGGTRVEPQEERYLLSLFEAKVEVTATSDPRAAATPYDAYWKERKYPYLVGPAVGAGSTSEDTNGAPAVGEQTMHYGDWVAPPQAQFAYYERYTEADFHRLHALDATQANALQPIEDGPGATAYYAFYGSWHGLDGDTLVNTLPTVRDVVPEADGYAVLWQVADTVPLTMEYETSVSVTADDAATPLISEARAVTVKDSVTGKEEALPLALTDTDGGDAGKYWFYPLETDTLDGIAYEPGKYYHKMTVTARIELEDAGGTGKTTIDYTDTRWLNPHFAADVINAETPDAVGANAARPTRKAVEAVKDPADATVVTGYKLTGEAGSEPKDDWLDEKGAVKDADACGDPQVIVRTARQLVNMAKYCDLRYKVPTNYTGISFTSADNNPVTWQYAQLASIDFTTYRYGAAGALLPGSSTGAPFTGIPYLGRDEGTDANSKVKTHGIYDGRGYAIRNMHITRSGNDGLAVNEVNASVSDLPSTWSSDPGKGPWDQMEKNGPRYYAGLFGQVIGGTLCNMRLEDTHVTVTYAFTEKAKASDKPTAEILAGTLVGRVGGNSTLDHDVLVNAAVEVTSASASATSSGTQTSPYTGTIISAGGLAGRVAGSSGGDYSCVTGCGIYVDPDLLTGTDIAETYKAYGVTLARSTDTSPEAESAVVGGLVGDLSDNVKVTDSFAAVKVRGGGHTGGSYIGGFAGRLNKVVELEDCYSAGYNTIASGETNVYGTQKGAYVGGFAGVVDGDDGKTASYRGTLYSTCSVNAADNSSGDHIGRFLGGKVGDGQEPAKSDATLYAAGTYDAGILLRGDETYLADDPPARTTTVTAYPYTRTLGNSYPYASGLTEHHGDWAQKVAAAGLFYWEQENGVYRYSLIRHTAAGSDTASTLCKEQHDDYHAVTDWGYGVFTTDKNQLPLPATTDIPEATGAAPAAMTSAFTAKYPDGALTLLAQGTNTATEKTNIETVTVNAAGTNVLYSINRAFAEAMGPQGTFAAMGASESDPYYIRTLKQLDNIPDGSSVTAPHNGCYEQTHDLNGTGYGTGYTGPNHFSGCYNGGSYRILELSTAGTPSYMTGLFKNLADDARLKNIILYSPTGNALMRYPDADGTNGTKGTDPISLGALAICAESGTVHIENCAAAGYTLTCGDQSVGGLVGVVGVGRSGGFTPATLHIDRCAAVNTLDMTYAEEGVGGLVGTVRENGHLYISNSYAGGKVIDKNAEDPTKQTTKAGIGGLVGCCKSTSDGNGSADYQHVYSYLDMTVKTPVATDTSHNAPLYFGIGPIGGVTGYDRADCYYLEGIFPADVVPHPSESNVDPRSLEELRELTLTSSDFGKVADAKHTFPTNTALKGQQYPFPAVVQDKRGGGTAYVHYGDWPVDGSGGGGTGGSTGGGTSSTTSGVPLLNDISVVVLYKDLSCSVWASDGTFTRWDTPVNSATSGSPLSIGAGCLPKDTDIVAAGIFIAGATLPSDFTENSSSTNLNITTSSGTYNIKSLKIDSSAIHLVKGLKKVDDFSSTFNNVKMPTAAGTTIDISSDNWIYPLAPAPHIIWLRESNSIRYGASITLTVDPTNGAPGPSGNIVFTFGNIPSDYLSTTDLPRYSGTSGDPPLPGPGVSSNGWEEGPGFEGQMLPPASTPTPAPTPTPTPTATPQTATPENATPEGAPAPTPGPTPTPTLTPTPAPTPEPTPEPTPAPEDTPEPTPTPEATPEPTPETTPEPTSEPSSTFPPG